MSVIWSWKRVITNERWSDVSERKREEKWKVLQKLNHIPCNVWPQSLYNHFALNRTTPINNGYNRIERMTEWITRRRVLCSHKMQNKSFDLKMAMVQFFVLGKQTRFNLSKFNDEYFSTRLSFFSVHRSARYEPLASFSIDRMCNDHAQGQWMQNLQWQPLKCDFLRNSLTLSSCFVIFLGFYSNIDHIP